MVGGKTSASGDVCTESLPVRKWGNRLLSSQRTATQYLIGQEITGVATKACVHLSRLKSDRATQLLFPSESRAISLGNWQRSAYCDLGVSRIRRLHNNAKF